MPYIKSDDYARAVQCPETPGELNYAVTCKAIEVLQGRMRAVQFGPMIYEMALDYLDHVGMSYANANAVMGVLECAARELTRRVRNISVSMTTKSLCTDLEIASRMIYIDKIAPYEDQKIKENGDVFPSELVIRG